MDILFHTDKYTFSYRVAGICIQNGKVLLQKPSNDSAFALPGGHVAFGETNAQALIREFREEMSVDISVGDLKWVGEVFFSWDNKPCHQICLYYAVDIQSDNIPMDSMFIGKEQMEGRKFCIEFHWVPLTELKNIDVYPTNAAELLCQTDDSVQHFIYRE